MTLEEFRQLLQQDGPPALKDVCLLALWYDAKGDWHKAHEQVDSLQDTTACRVHAYLHRKEGDQWNADYWYRKAGFPRPDIPLEQEWEQLVLSLL